MSKSSSDIMILPCLKNRGHKPPFEYEQALIYLKLRSSGCSHKDALNFCKVRHCKHDITQSVIGPEGFRIIKQGLDLKNRFSVMQGWLYNQEPHYALGGDFIVHVDEIMKSDKQDDQMAEDIEKKKQQYKADQIYRDKLQKKYLREINAKYNYHNLTKPGLAKKLKELQQATNQDKLEVK